MRLDRKRLVFDTSALIPVCLYPERETAQAFKNILLEHDVFCSTHCWQELHAVISRPKFDAWQPFAQRLAWVNLFRHAVIFVEPSEPITDCRDPKDNPFLELAVAAKADFLISSDVHLLEMHPYRNIQILNWQAFKTL